MNTLRNTDIEKRVAALLQRMTLEEKIGQMTQLTLGVLGGKFEPAERPDMAIPQERLDDVISRHKVGSVLNVADTALTPQQWHCIVSQLQKASIQATGIPCIYGLDMNHGANYAIGATILPHNINMAATFNSALVRRGAEITAYETRACDVPWTFNPTVDLSRNPLWPRVFENFGEDAYLNAAMGTAAVEGLQGPDPANIDRFHIAACLKHFMGYGSPVSGRDRTHSSIGEMEMREKHFEPYRKAIHEGGALSVMVNSTTNNGVPFHANARYLTRWLKQELNWDGVIVTDWADIDNLWNREYVAHDKKEAIALAINAGIDMAMEPYSTDFCTLFKELVEENAVPMSRIDDACARVLRMKMRLGLFETPDTCADDYPLFGSREFAADATRAAVESMVLLKNDGHLLPLKHGSRILIAGPNADSMRALNGGWTYTWQGQLTDDFAQEHNSILQSMRQRFGNDNIIYAPGVTYAPHDWNDWGRENEPDFDSAVRAAESADVIMACVGETSYCETPGNTDDLHLSANQRELVRRLAATGKPLLLILNQGRPRLIPEIEPLASAIVNIMLPGNYGGDALAMLLAGDENFSGRMPISYPRYHGAFIPYDYKKGECVPTMAGAYNYDASVEVQWSFGHGLSYTTFEYSGLTTDRSVYSPDDIILLKVKLRNSGKLRGKESVLLYSSDLVASVSPDNRRLRAFSKHHLEAGEEITVEFSLPVRELAFVNPDGKWVVERGEFRLSVGTEAITVAVDSTRIFD